MSRWIDITLPIGPASVAWEGLAPPRLGWLARADEGAAVNVGQLDCCLHTGTHADAPWHVDREGMTIDRVDPERFIGPATLVRIEDERTITAAELRSLGMEDGRGRDEALARVLVATPRPYDGRRFPERAIHLEPEAADYLLWLGARLVGVDQPSLDPLDSKAMDAHRVVFAADGGVLENLALAGCAPGRYRLSALPIKVIGADAAPVRALIRPLEG